MYSDVVRRGAAGGIGIGIGMVIAEDDPPPCKGNACCSCCCCLLMPIMGDELQANGESSVAPVNANRSDSPPVVDLCWKGFPLSADIGGVPLTSLGICSALERPKSKRP